MAAYNFFSRQSSKESPFVLMFGRDPITPFLSLLEPSPRYWGERGGHLHLDALQCLYVVTAENLKQAREKESTETEMNSQNDLKIGDLVLVRNVNLGVFEPKYSPNYRIIAIYGNNHIVVKAPDGKVQVQHKGNIKKIDPVDKVISLVPSAEDFEKFGRKTKLLIHPDNIPDTNISLPSRKQIEVADGESKISKNYHGLHEKLRKSTVKISENSKGQTKKAVKGSKISDSYQNPHEKPKMSNIEMLNRIDCTVQKSNKVDFSLISASCPATLETTRGKSIETQ